MSKRVILVKLQVLTDLVDLLDCVSQLICLTVYQCQGLVLSTDSSSSKSEVLNLKDIEVLLGNMKQSWFKQVHAGKYLWISHINTFTAKIGQNDRQARASLQAGHTSHTMGPCSGPKD